MATYMYLEYSENSLNMANSGSHEGILCNIGENCNKQNIFVCHSHLCVKLLSRDRAGLQMNSLMHF